MSIKTLMKRIALVTVSTLGLGLMSTAPTNAAYDAANSDFTVTAVGRVGYGIQFVVKSTGSITNGDELDASSYAHFVLLEAPTSAGKVATTSAVNGAWTSGLEQPNATALNQDSVTVAAFSANTSTGGTLVHTITGSKNFAGSVADATIMDTYTAGTYKFLVWVDTSASALKAASAGPIAKTVSVTLGGTPNQIVLSSATGTADSSSSTTNLVTATIKDSAGIETIMDTSIETFAVRSSTDTEQVFKGFIGDTLSATWDARRTETNGFLDTTVATTGAGFLDTGKSPKENTPYHSSNIRFWVGSSYAGVTTFNIVGMKGFAGVSASYSLTTTSPAVISRIVPAAAVSSWGRADTGTTTAHGLRSSSYTAALTVATQANAAVVPTATSLFASTTSGKSISFEVQIPTAGALVRGSVAAISTTTPVPTGVSVGAFDYTANETTTIKTFTATAPQPGDGYVVTWNMSNGTSYKYSVTYKASSVDTSIGSMVTNIDSSPKAEVGAAVTINATVRDGFGALVSGANVRMTHNRTATGITSDVLTATTNSSGVASFTVTDAFAGTTATSKYSAGSFTLTAATSNAAGALAGGTKTINFVNPLHIAAGSVTLTEDAQDNDTTANIVDAVITETITVLTETGTALSGVAYTATISDGLYEGVTTYAGGASLLTGFTDSNGQAFIRVAGYKSGVQTVTFTVGSTTVSDTFTVKSAAAKLRAVEVDSAALSVATDKTGYVTVTAKDVYGNVVPGATLTVSYTGTAGRIVSYNGAQGNTATTGDDGKLVVGIFGEAAGTGTLTVEYASASTASTTSQGVAPITRAAKATSTVTVSGTPAAIAAAEAATDAAAEAIDAANAATDAANLAAEAADAATVAAEEARDAADAATAAVEELATQVATLMAALKAQITTLANTVAKIAKKVKA